MALFKRKRRYIESEIAPDEIFLDSENLPKFDTHQFEGRLERPISKTSIAVLSSFFLLFGILSVLRLGILQIKKGEAYFIRSENNVFNKEPMFSYRGVIYDRNRTELTWNESPEEGKDIPRRAYIDKSGFGSLLGYVGYPKKDKNGFYYNEEYKGKDGIEKQFNDLLSGENGIILEETDVHGKSLSQNVVNQPIPGENLVLSVDAKLETKMYEAISSLVGDGGFQGGAGIIMDIHSGELLALTSVPEYSSQILSDGSDSLKISEYLKDSRKPFINRALSGLYTPGSIVKPFMGLAVLNEGVVTSNTSIFANGSISLPNPYFPELKSVFKDHGVFGWVDLKKAIAISSDVYFYEVSGGFEGQKGIGIENIDKYSRLFRIAEKTGINLGSEAEGIIPTPEWKAKNFKGDIWRIGDTYNTSIGQYGYQVTPIQMVRAAGALATKGTLVTPTVLKRQVPIGKDEIETIKGIDPLHYGPVFEGMRAVVTEGTAQVLNVPYVKVAAKTGTAQVGGNRYVNSWIMGFFPYDNPKYSFVILMDRSPKANTDAASGAMRQVFDFMNQNTPEYLK